MQAKQQHGMVIKTKGKGLAIWRFLKRAFLILFLFQLFYILLFEMDQSPDHANTMWKLDQRQWIEKRLCCYEPDFALS